MKTSIKLKDKTVLNGIVIGTTLKNTGNVDLHIYKGKSTTGDPIIVKAGERFGIQKGFSIITVSNPDTIQSASLVTTRNK